MSNLPRLRRSHLAGTDGHKGGSPRFAFRAGSRSAFVTVVLFSVMIAAEGHLGGVLAAQDHPCDGY